MRLSAQIFAGLAALGLTTFSFRTEACSCGVRPYLGETVPVDGTTDVPTNVVPWLDFSGTPRLLDPEGKEVPLAEVKASWGLICTEYGQVIPASELAPHTTYTLQVIEGEWTSEPETAAEYPQVTFTTGAGPLDEALSPPSLNVEFINAEEFIDSCLSNSYRGCVHGTYEGLVEVTELGYDGQPQTYVTLMSGTSTVHVKSSDPSGCIELRAVNAAGQRSEPREFCYETADLPRISRDAGGWPEGVCSMLSDLEKEDPTEPKASETDTDASDGTKADDDNATASGCSVSRIGSGATGLWFLVAIFGSVALGRRRRAAVLERASPFSP